MKYITDQQRKVLIKDLERRHGRINKIWNDEKIIGYVIRCEIDEPTDKSVNVIFKVSFNYDYYFNDKLNYQLNDDLELESNSLKSYSSLSDLKFFPIKNVCKIQKLDVEKCCDYNFFGTLNTENINQFIIGAMSISKRYVDKLKIEISNINNYISNYYVPENSRNKIMDITPDLTDKKCNNLTNFIFNQINSILNYYINKKVYIYFV